MPSHYSLKKHSTDKASNSFINTGITRLPYGVWVFCPGRWCFLDISVLWWGWISIFSLLHSIIAAFDVVNLPRPARPPSVLPGPGLRDPSARWPEGAPTATLLVRSASFSKITDIWGLLPHFLLSRSLAALIIVPDGASMVVPVPVFVTWHASLTHWSIIIAPNTPAAMVHALIELIRYMNACFTPEIIPIAWQLSICGLLAGNFFLSNRHHQPGADICI